jgi:predicted transcriptional regulator/DNA-binding XRE family transcriptional regulator
LTNFRLSWRRETLPETAMKRGEKAMLGHKVRRFRQDRGLSQAEMASEIGISPSYLNLIEHNQRPVTVPLLFRLGQTFDVDLKAFAEDESARLAAELVEVFHDPLFADERISQREIRDLVASGPNAASAFVALYAAYRRLWETTQVLASEVDDSTLSRTAEIGVSPLDEVRDVQEQTGNHFAELEAAAEALWRDAGLVRDELQRGLIARLGEAHGVKVRLMPAAVMGDIHRRFDAHRGQLLLSEALLPSGRTFQLAVQIAFLEHGPAIDTIIARAQPRHDETRTLLRIALAGYFAGAVMMPYESFLESARELRHDIELLRRRFWASFEQVCHRLTTLQRPGARGVPFFFIRVDNAGNVSKRLSGGGWQFARFGGTCPRWVVHEAFQDPGTIHTQVSELADDARFFTIARALEAPWTEGTGQAPRFAIALGCDLRDARHIAYADGIETAAPRNITPVGVSCRVCERLDCAHRAHPPLNRALRFDENIRRAGLFEFAH